MHARVVLGVGKGVLSREVSSVQECPHRGVPLHCIYCMNECLLLWFQTAVGPQAQALPPEGGGEKVAEVQYLSQLKQPQWPINGLYRMHHRAAHNHFKRHADIKHIGACMFCVCVLVVLCV